MEVLVDGVEDAQVVLHLRCDKNGDNRKCQVGGHKTSPNRDCDLVLTKQDVQAVIQGYQWSAVRPLNPGWWDRQEGRRYGQ